MSRRPFLRCCGALVGVGLLLTSCSGSSGGSGGDGGTRSSPPPSPSPSPSSDPSPDPASTAATAGLDFSPDPARAPKTRAQAERLARAVAVAPADWGPGYVKRDPYESDPGFRPVLDANCVWQRKPLPGTILATLTRYSELPAEDGKGPIRVAAVVTVHRGATDAAWEMAGTLEEALRCPDQQLRQGERITGLLSQGGEYGQLGNSSAEDTLAEGGEYYSDELGGPHYYYWIQSRLAQVTVAVAGRGAPGRTEDEVGAALTEGAALMLTRVKNELEAAG